MDWQMITAEWKLGWLYPERIPDAATSALDQGFDAPSLRVAAGLSPDADPREICAVFGAAIDELGWHLPTDREAARCLVSEYARRVADGELSPDLGANDLWSLADHLDDDERTYRRLQVIAELRDSLRQVSKDDRLSVERAILREAQLLKQLTS